jgi:DNA repair ATPase RecN
VGAGLRSLRDGHGEARFRGEEPGFADHGRHGERAGAGLAAVAHGPARKEIEFAINDLEGEALINKYEELAASLPDNYYVFYNYGVELDRFITSPEAKGKDIAALKQKLEQLYIKARGIQSTIEVNLQLSKMYYDRMYEAQEQASRIKGTKPTEVSLKNELLAKAKELINKCVPYAEAAVDLLAALKEYKYSDKANYKLALEILANAAKQNGNAAKVAEYEKKKAEVDKL